MISIQAYIDEINTVKPPKQYYATRYHRNYIRSLNAEDYGIWCDYIRQKNIERCRRYRAEHKEEIKRKWKKYAKEHREELNEYKNKWAKEHPETSRRYRKNNKEKIKDNHRRYRENNRNKIRAYDRAYKQSHWLEIKIRHCDYYMRVKDNEEFKKKNRERALKYYYEHREKIKKDRKIYYAKNKHLWKKGA